MLSYNITKEFFHIRLDDAIKKIDKFIKDNNYELL